MGLNPIFNTLISLISVNVGAKAFTSLSDNTENQDQIVKTLYQIFFPFFILFSIYAFSGIYVVTTVQDREEKLRYLLNFSGMRSSAYYLGLLLAEVIIFLFPQCILMLLSRVIGIDVYFKAAGLILPGFVAFAFPFILTNYLIGFLYTSSEKAFKLQIVPLIIVTIVPGFVYTMLGLEISSLTFLSPFIGIITIIGKSVQYGVDFTYRL
jgi:hypothetical protein